MRRIRVPVLFKMKGMNLTTVHAKGVAHQSYSRSLERGSDTAAKALKLVLESLEDSKAENIASINISGKSALADYMVVVTGRSNRHVTAIAEHLFDDVKAGGVASVRIEGLETGDWVLIDCGDIIVHIFRPEIREFYNLEKMWAAPDLEEETVH
jgi:ribosome-associated protein